MVAVVIREPGRMEVDRFPIPSPGPDEALIAMETASICGSDVHVLFDNWAREDALGRPGYPGHEGIGTVLESRSARFPVGTRVLTVPPGWYGGCFGEYQVVHERWLLALPPGVDPQRLLMAQQLGATLLGIRHFWDGPGAPLGTIIGSGSAGLFFVQHLRRLGFGQIAIVDLEPRRLDVARSLGADVVVDAGEGSILEATMEASRGEGADLVIEAAGYDATRALAIECVRKWGRVGFFGYPENPGLVPFPFERAYRKAAQINHIIDTSLEEGLRSYNEALSAIADGTIDVGYCLREQFPLEATAEALQVARERSGASVKLRIDLRTERTVQAGS